jgi:hypothetical protein
VICLQIRPQSNFDFLSQLLPNRHKRPIASHSECVFARAKVLDPLTPKPHQSCARTNEPFELEHALARGLEGKKIQLKNNKLRL